jgi:hypothetical protein
MALMPGMPRAFDHALRVVAIALAASLAVAAWHDVSKAWDTWAYHLPFAARMLGIVGPDAYVFSPDNAQRYAGFPLFAELLQGLFWKITGRPECATFVALFSLFGLVAYLKRAFAIAPHVAFIALLAIPLVQIHATQCYVDLPANVGLTVLILLVHRAWVDPGPPRVRLLIGAAACAIATANSKFQLVPLVLVASAALFARTFRDRKSLLVFAVALPLVFATPIKNFVVHGNPVWPVELGFGLPYAETRYESAPYWLEHAPRPARFLLSIVEWNVDRWSVDQWTPPEHPAKRMGGFFGAYVIAGLAGLALAAWKKRTRETKVALSVFGGATLVVSLLPQSHELRYYLFWMLLLVASNLVLWFRDRPVPVTLVALAAFAFVAWKTNGSWLYMSGDSFSQLVASRVDAKVIETARDGDRVCVADDPWTFLYAAPFHGANGKRFTVLEAKRREDCSPSALGGSPGPGRAR